MFRLREHLLEKHKLTPQQWFDGIGAKKHGPRKRPGDDDDWDAKSSKVDLLRPSQARSAERILFACCIRLLRGG